jgi:hypothetical protein
MQLYKVLCGLEVNDAAILLYMTSACARIGYHCAASSVLYGLIPQAGEGWLAGVGG